MGKSWGWVDPKMGVGGGEGVIHSKVILVPQKIPNKASNQLLTQYLRNTQQVYSRTGIGCISFFISMFVVSVIIVMNE